MNESCGLSDIGSDLILVAFLRTSQRFEVKVEAALADSGLSLAKLGVLNHLVKSGEPLPLGRLAERISCVKSNMTQLIDRMEADGLVSRVNDPEDRRSVRAAITEEGLRRYGAGARILEKAEQELLKSIRPAEREQLVRLLGQLAAE